MENASKALIIAGAILLAILLISLGIMIFNQAQDTVSGSGMTEAEITAFNNKFLKYEGKNKKGTIVKSLIQEVRATNSDSGNKDGVTVGVKFNEDATANPAPDTQKIKNNSTYEVSLTYGASGRVSEITIKGSINE